MRKCRSRIAAASAAALLCFLALPLLAHQPEGLIIDSKILGEKRGVVVYLPQAYAAGGKRYPVIYVTDAGSRAEHTEWRRSGRLTFGRRCCCFS